MTRFAEEMKKVQNFLNQYPQNHRQFIRDIVFYNAIHHAEKEKLLAVPLFFDEEKAPVETPVPEPALDTSNINAWLNI